MKDGANQRVYTEVNQQLQHERHLRLQSCNFELFKSFARYLLIRDFQKAHEPE